jgi:hypothetical protein
VVNIGHVTFRIRSPAFGLETPLNENKSPVFYAVKF